MVRFRFLLIALLALAALAATRAPSDQTTAGPRPAQQPLLKQADATLEEMSRLTGLPIKGPVKKQIVSREESRQYVIENLHHENTPEEIHAQEATMKALGLVSRDFSLEKFLVAFYTEQGAGFYDPRRKTMFIADWLTPDLQQQVLAHELTHALQDQNYDLERFLHAARDNDDASAARQAVVEGHATAAMMQHMLGGANLAALPSLTPLMEPMLHQQMEAFPTFSSAPYFFRDMALFPYIQGLGLVQKALGQGGWKNADALFQSPPTSTREVFSPQAYFEHLKLPTVTLPRPPVLEQAPGLKRIEENTLGELGYDALLGQLVSDQEAKRTATGWQADRYIVYEDVGRGRYALVARSRWQDAETVLAFFRDVHTMLGKKFPELAPDKRSAEDRFVATTASGAVIVLRRGEEVLWAEGVPESGTDAMLKFLSGL